MKTTKLIATLATLVLTGSAVFAGDPAAITITNAKGQSVVLYRDNAPSVAVYVGGRGVGASNATGALLPTTVLNSKGQAIALYRAE